MFGSTQKDLALVTEIILNRFSQNGYEQIAKNVFICADKTEGKHLTFWSGKPYFLFHYLANDYGVVGSPDVDVTI